MPKQQKAASAPEPHQNAIAMLKADHRKVEELFKQFEEHTHGPDQDSDAKGELVQQICRELIVHTQLEEEIFYPACREKGVEAKTLDEAEVEHDGAKVMITDLLSAAPDDKFYDAKVIVLKEYIRHHVHEEEQARSGVFALAVKAGVETSELGDEMAARKEELLKKAKKALTAPELSTLNFQPERHTEEQAAALEDGSKQTKGKSAGMAKAKTKASSKSDETATQSQSRGRGERTRHDQDEDHAKRAPQHRSTRGYDEHDEDYPAGRPRQGRSRDHEEWNSGDGYPSDDRQNRGFGARGRSARHDEDHDEERHDPRNDGRYDSPRGRNAGDNSDSHWDNERGGRNQNRQAQARKPQSVKQDDHEHGRSYRDEFDDHGRYGQHGSDRSYQRDQEASRSSWSGGNRMRNHSQTQGGHGGQFRGASRGGVGSRNGARSDR